MRTSTLFGLLATFATSAMADSVSLGRNWRSGEANAWFNDVDPCTAWNGDIAYLSNSEESPCGRRFSLHGFPDLHFEGCGGDVSLWQTDTFIANCPYAPAKFECWGSGPHDGDEPIFDLAPAGYGPRTSFATPPFITRTPAVNSQDISDLFLDVDPQG
ncbi:hypothetical protein BKA61DRAFT_712071 [Leptodontidium sp. MPI-SDFR-AT-0119]|nr:hypothetical protein BKA61DRAFT_712071 [Leptodontidium sp. MPI-SDFR-AT-0119]